MCLAVGMPFMIQDYGLALALAMAGSYLLFLLFLHTGKWICKAYNLKSSSIWLVTFYLVIILGIYSVLAPQTIIVLIFRGMDGGPGGLMLTTLFCFVGGLILAVLVTALLLKEHGCTKRESWLVTLWAIVIYPAILIGIFIAVAYSLRR